MISTRHTIYTMLTMVLLTILLASVIFSYTQLQYHKDSFAYDLGKEVINSWKSPYIDAISVSDSVTCPQGYKNILDYNWPGTSGICSCSVKNGIYELFQLKSETCSAIELTNSCTNIPAQDSTPLLKWKNSKVICYHTSASTFLSGDESCSLLTHQFCGFGDQRVCILKSESCPISFFQESTTNTEYPFLAKYQISSNTFLNYGYLENYYPTIAIRIGQERICSISSKRYISKLTSEYTYLKEKKRSDCIKDEDVKILSSIGENDFFTINGVSNIISQLPAYPPITNEINWVLGVKNVVDWKYSCRSASDFTIGISINRLELMEESNFLTAALALSVISWFISVVILPLRLLYFSRKDKTETKAQIIITSSIDQIFKILNFIAIIISGYLFNRTRNWFSTTIHDNCSSAFIKSEVLEVYKDNTLMISSTILASLALVFLIFLMDVIHYISYCKGGMVRKSEYDPAKVLPYNGTPNNQSIEIVKKTPNEIDEEETVNFVKTNNDHSSKDSETKSPNRELSPSNPELKKASLIP